MDRRNWFLGLIAWLLGMKAAKPLSFSASPDRLQCDAELEPVLRVNGKWVPVRSIETYAGLRQIKVEGSITKVEWVDGKFTRVHKDRSAELRHLLVQLLG